jgi:hypothetical protein
VATRNREYIYYPFSPLQEGERLRCGAAPLDPADPPTAFVPHAPEARR